jgi:hypothetical protein
MATGGLKMARPVCALTIAIFILSASPARFEPRLTAQQQKCLHAGDETPEQATRRRLALTLVRRINSEQILQFARAKTYQPLSAFLDIQSPAGFSTQLIVNAAGYAVSIKDTLDPCSFAYFSDQEAVIYTAQPIR